MCFSRHSVFMSLFLFSILAIIGGYATRHASWKTIKLSCIIVFLCIIRFLFPFEFFTSTPIRVELFYSSLDHFLRQEILGNIKIMDILFFIWIAGTIIHLLHLISILYTQWKYIQDYKLPKENPLYEMCHECSIRIGTPLQESIALSSDSSIPGMIGFFKPNIILPIDAELLPKDCLYYILCHELYHFKGKDLWIKLGLEVLCSLLWWNPAVYFLKDGIDHILELRCDRNVCSLISPKEKALYAEALTLVAKTQVYSIHFFALEYTGKKPCIISRFEQILPEENNRKMQKKNTHFTIVLFILVILLFLLSYCFTLQPAFQSPPVEYETTIQDNTNNLTFILRQSDGTLMYFENGIHRGDLTVDMLEEEPYCNLTIREGY